MPRGGPHFASRKLSVYSRRPLAAVDARTLEARREKALVAELTAHIGGDPSVVQRLLIARAARFAVIVELMERKIIEKGTPGDLEGRQVLAYANSLRQVLAMLGLERASDRPATLKGYLKAV
jgi:hypothetical protein